VEWNGGLERWNGMMEWWAGTSNKLGSTIAMIGIVVAFTHRKRIHACRVCTSLSWELNYLQLANT